MFSSVAFLGFYLRAQSSQWGFSLPDSWDPNVSQPVGALEPNLTAESRCFLPRWQSHTLRMNSLVFGQRLKVLPRQVLGTPPPPSLACLMLCPANSSHCNCSEHWSCFPQLIKNNITSLGSPRALAWTKKCLHSINWDKHSFPFVWDHSLPLPNVHRLKSHFTQYTQVHNCLQSDISYSTGLDADVQSRLLKSLVWLHNPPFDCLPFGKKMVTSNSYLIY